MILEPRLEQLFSQATFWRGTAAATNSDDLAKVYTEIAIALEAGEKITNIPAFAAWYSRRVR